MDKKLELKREQTKNELELKKEQIKKDLSAVLNTKEGRRVFWFLIKEVCGFYKSPADVSNVYNTYFESGKRKVGEALINKIEQIEPTFRLPDSKKIINHSYKYLTYHQ